MYAHLSCMNHVSGGERSLRKRPMRKQLSLFTTRRLPSRSVPRDTVPHLTTNRPQRSQGLHPMGLLVEDSCASTPMRDRRQDFAMQAIVSSSSLIFEIDWRLCVHTLCVRQGWHWLAHRLHLQSHAEHDGVVSPPGHPSVLSPRAEHNLRVHFAFIRIPRWR